MQSLMIEILNRLLLLFILIVPNVYLILIFLRTKKDLKTLLIPTLCLSLLTIIFLNKLIFTGGGKNEEEAGIGPRPGVHLVLVGS